MCTQAKRGRCSQDIGRMELGGTAWQGQGDRAWNEHHRVTRELKVTGQAGVRAGLAAWHATAMAHGGSLVRNGREGVVRGTQTQVQALVSLLEVVTSNKSGTR